MKETEGWVKIKKYTYDNGKPVCGECIFWPSFPVLCKFMDMGAVDYGFPGPTCPVWHGEGKWKPIQGEPTEPGYYWWLPVCSSGNANEPSHWNIISWHHKDEQRQKSGTFVGPILPPVPPREYKP